MPTVSYEEIKVDEMELPPGFRGYGKDMTIKHTKTDERQAMVDQIVSEIEEEGLDRYDLQKTLMPYDELLPERYRGRNERLDERFENGQ